MPLDPSIPLSAVGANPNQPQQQMANALQVFQLKDAMQQRQMHQQAQVDEKRTAKKLDALTNRGAGLFLKYRGLLDQGFSEQSASAAMQEDFKREIGGLSSERDDKGAPLFTPDELNGLGNQFDAGSLGAVLPKLLGAKNALDLYMKDRELKAQGQKTAMEADSQAETKRHNMAMENIAKDKSGGFTGEMGNLMGALAERGVTLPAGFRSKEQQRALLQGVLDRNPGKTADEIADLVKTGQIEFGANKKETTTAAGVAGRVEVAQNELKEFVPLVREASALVPRGKFVPLNKLMQMADSSISDPNLKALKIRINAVLNAYDMLAARGGTDMEKRREVRSLLMSADGPEALKSALDSFELEADAAKRAAIKATKVSELPDRPGSGPLPTTNQKGWKLHVDANGNKAYVGPNNEIEEVQ